MDLMEIEIDGWMEMDGDRNRYMDGWMDGWR